MSEQHFACHPGDPLPNERSGHRAGQLRAERAGPRRGDSEDHPGQQAAVQVGLTMGAQSKLSTGSYFVAFYIIEINESGLFDFYFGS